MAVEFVDPRRALEVVPHKFFDVVAESVDKLVARRGIIFQRPNPGETGRMNR